jgi:hypothetical protein
MAFLGVAAHAELSLQVIAVLTQQGQAMPEIRSRGER